VDTYSPLQMSESPLTAASLAESLDMSPRDLRVGPMRRRGAYHGRVLTFPNVQAIDSERPDAARLLAERAVCRLVYGHRLEVTVMPDGVSLAVIALKPV
jgi:hypothetical protein